MTDHVQAQQHLLMNIKIKLSFIFALFPTFTTWMFLEALEAIQPLPCDRDYGPTGK